MPERRLGIRNSTGEVPLFPQPPQTSAVVSGAKGASTTGDTDDVSYLVKQLPHGRNSFATRSITDTCICLTRCCITSSVRSIALICQSDALMRLSRTSRAEMTCSAHGMHRPSHAILYAFPELRLRHTLVPSISSHPEHQVASGMLRGRRLESRGRRDEAETTCYVW